MKLSDTKFNTLIENYRSFYQGIENLHSYFGGPSVYFHQQALIECRQNFLSDRHLEMIYATLASWGMHRMGKTKTKMVDFSLFKDTILKMRPRLLALKDVDLRNFDTEPVDILNEITEICFELTVSISQSKIVGNSKVLAHIFPNLVPPVDREYSIRFFSETLYNFSGLEEEKKFYRHIIKKCYSFVRKLDNDDMSLIDTRFNSSAPKMFDNFIMLYLKALKNSA
jgi:hypothetical protein